MNFKYFNIGRKILWFFMKVECNESVNRFKKVIFVDYFFYTIIMRKKIKINLNYIIL